MPLKERVGGLLDLADGRALAGRVAEGSEHVAAAEARAVPGQAGRRGQRFEYQLPLGLRERPPALQAADAAGVEAEPRGPAAPFRRQHFGSDGAVLHPPRGQGRDLGGVTALGAMELHRGFNLCAPPREGSDDSVRDSADLGRALADRRPSDPEGPRQLGAQLGLVEKAGGARMRVDEAPVESGPAPVIAPDEVRDQDVRVQLRIAGAARAMYEGRGDRPLATDGTGSAGAAASEGGRSFEVLER